MSIQSGNRAGAHHDFFHHLQLALVVASLISLLHAFGALGWLDAAMLRLAAAAQIESRQSSEMEGVLPQNMPLVLTINQSLYEEQFLQTSPLNRTKLAQIIETIAKGPNRPAALVSDIDLSPMAGQSSDAGQERLNMALASLVGSGVRLVMVMPFRVKSPELIDRKASWMRDMCALKMVGDKTNGQPVVFALSEAVTNLGQVLQYDTSRPTLGMVVADRHSDMSQLRPAAQAHQICQELLAPGGVEKWKLTLLSALFSDEAMSAVIGEASQHPRFRPFNPAYLQRVLSATMPISALDSLPLDLAGKSHSLEARTVFLGGSFDRVDQFDAPLAGERVPGVLVHALTYASEADGIQPWGGNFAFVLDVVIGFGCAVLFQMLWTWRRRVNLWAIQRGGLASFIGSKLSWLLTVFVLIVTLFLLSAIVVNFIYPRGGWINPGPVMIGVAAKFVLSSMATVEAGSGRVHAPLPRLHTLLDWACVLALVAFAWNTNLHH